MLTFSRASPGGGADHPDWGLFRPPGSVGAPVLSTWGGATLYTSHFRNPGKPYGMATHDAFTREPDALYATDPVRSDRMMKELTVLGYFTSEIGCTQALRFIEVPGGYRGSAPYRRGEHAWFS